MIKITQKLIVNIGFLIAISFVGHTQIPVGRTVMDYSVEFGGENLIMNGGGRRSLLVVGLYSAGLYIQEKSKDPIKIAYADETMAIRIRITSNIIAARTRFLKSLEHGFKNATNGDTTSIQDRIEYLKKIYSDPLTKNDLIEFVHIKGEGINCYKNNKKLGVIKGQDFKFALFKIWLGEKPISGPLKKAMLSAE